MNIEDRISKLPNDVLLKIMSFLNTKQAVQTCVLSKRWKPLWRSLPNLDLDFDTFPFQQEIDDEDEDEEEMKMASFSKFINKVLCRRCRTDLVKVCVQSPSYDWDASVLADLICYAVEHNVQQLTVHLLSDCPYLFPESFWTCRSLTVLELKANDVTLSARKLPKLLACPALKSLHLSGFSPVGPNFETTVFSGCPNLETLQLFDIMAGSENLCIKADNLRSLVLSFALLIDIKVEIYAPRLTNFKYSGIPPRLTTFKYSGIPHLASVDDVYFDIKTAGFKKYGLRLIDILNEFHHAKSLTLSLPTVEVLNKCPPSLLDRNLRPCANLKVKVDTWLFMRPESFAWILSCFLNSSTGMKLYDFSGMDSELAGYESPEDSD